MKTKLHHTFHNSDPKILGVWDCSVYDDNIVLCEAMLQIKVPGFTETRIIPVTPNQYTPIRSIELDLSKDIINIPDGVYCVTASIQPHDKVKQEYMFYRTTLLEMQWNKAFLNLDLNVCGINIKDSEHILTMLIEAQMHIAAAKANISNYECNEKLAAQHYSKAKTIINTVEKYINCHGL